MPAPRCEDPAHNVRFLAALRIAIVRTSAQCRQRRKSGADAHVGPHVIVEQEEIAAVQRVSFDRLRASKQGREIRLSRRATPMRARSKSSTASRFAHDSEIAGLAGAKQGRPAGSGASSTWPLASVAWPHSATSTARGTSAARRSPPAPSGSFTVNAVSARLSSAAMPCKHRIVQPGLERHHCGGIAGEGAWAKASTWVKGRWPRTVSGRFRM